MKKYPEYKGLNLRQVNDDMLRWWKGNDTFQKSIDTRKDAQPWVFYEGPAKCQWHAGYSPRYGTYH